MSTVLATTDSAPQPRGLGRVRTLLRDYVGALRNWPTIGLLVAITHPSPLPPRNGLLFPPLRSMPITLRSRSGATIRCRLDEASPFVEIFVRDDYAVPGLDWAGLRTVVDVGANVGMATIWMSQRATRARFVAVEPAAQTAARLRANIDRNGLAGRVEVVEAGVAAAAGRGSLVFDQGYTCHAFVEPGGGPVELRTLEEILDSHGIGSVDLLKIDTEGGEYEILQGPVLQRVRAIAGEYHAFPDRDPAALMDRLREAGFEVWMEPQVRDHGRFHALRPRP